MGCNCTIGNRFPKNFPSQIWPHRSILDPTERLHGSWFAVWGQVWGKTVRFNWLWVHFSPSLKPNQQSRTAGFDCYAGPFQVLNHADSKGLHDRRRPRSFRAFVRVSEDSVKGTNKKRSDLEAALECETANILMQQGFSNFDRNGKALLKRYKQIA